MIGKFDDLEDDLGNLPTSDSQPVNPVDSLSDGDKPPAYMVSEKAIYTERCKACNGSGTFYSYSGRAVGRCFKCKGKGERSFKTSAETRARARTTAANRKQATVDKWTSSTLGIFLAGAASWSDFARSLNEQGIKHGELSDKQRVAATSMMEKVEARQAKRDAQRKEQDERATIDLTNLPAGRYAVPGSDTRLKVLVNKPGSRSKWKGYIFVSDAAEYGARTNYGKQAPDSLYSGKIESELATIMADPHAASIAYGKLTGTCGVCGRILENPDSIAAGIGPVCAAKF